MNDDTKRLLELAAKAAGIKVGEWIEVGVHSGFTVDHGIRPNGICWNPLADDGDALRLAVVLNMRIENHIRHPFVAVFAGSGFGSVKTEEPHSVDKLAATRLAIVRAAAIIGEALP